MASILKANNSFFLKLIQTKESIIKYKSSRVKSKT
jgi:hypothetical protein